MAECVEDYLKSLEYGSENEEMWINVLNNNKLYKDEDYCYEVLEIKLVNNSSLRSRFEFKRMQFTEYGYTEEEMKSFYGFAVEAEHKLWEIVTKGPLNRPAQYHILGNNDMGFRLWRHPDVCMKFAAMKFLQNVHLVVYKFMYGRKKHIIVEKFRKDPLSLLPTTGYDSHVSALSATRKSTVSENINYSQVYLYHLDPITKEALQPTHVYPVAVVSLIQKDVVQQLETIRPTRTLQEPLEIEHVTWNDNNDQCKRSGGLLHERESLTFKLESNDNFPVSKPMECKLSTVIDTQLPKSFQKLHDLFQLKPLTEKFTEINNNKIAIPPKEISSIEDDMKKMRPKIKFSGVGRGYTDSSHEFRWVDLKPLSQYSEIFHDVSNNFTNKTNEEVDGFETSLKKITPIGTSQKLLLPTLTARSHSFLACMKDIPPGISNHQLPHCNIEKSTLSSIPLTEVSIENLHKTQNLQSTVALPNMISPNNQGCNKEADSLSNIASVSEQSTSFNLQQYLSESTESNVYSQTDISTVTENLPIDQKSIQTFEASDSDKTSKDKPLSFELDNQLNCTEENMSSENLLMTINQLLESLKDSGNKEGDEIAKSCTANPNLPLSSDPSNINSKTGRLKNTTSKDHTTVQHKTKGLMQSNSSGSDVKNRAKKNMGGVTVNFHGRTLLKGKEVPPRYIPLTPIYLKKPLKASGQPQVIPVDPRSKKIKSSLLSFDFKLPPFYYESSNKDFCKAQKDTERLLSELENITMNLSLKPHNIMDTKNVKLNVKYNPKKNIPESISSVGSKDQGALCDIRQKLRKQFKKQMSGGITSSKSSKKYDGDINSVVDMELSSNSSEEGELQEEIEKSRYIIIKPTSDRYITDKKRKGTDHKNHHHENKRKKEEHCYISKKEQYDLLDSEYKKMKYDEKCRQEEHDLLEQIYEDELEKLRERKKLKMHKSSISKNKSVSVPNFKKSSKPNDERLSSEDKVYKEYGDVEHPRWSQSSLIDDGYVFSPIQIKNLNQSSTPTEASDSSGYIKMKRYSRLNVYNKESEYFRNKGNDKQSTESKHMKDKDARSECFKDRGNGMRSDQSKPLPVCNSKSSVPHIKNTSSSSSSTSSPQRFSRLVNTSDSYDSKPVSPPQFSKPVSPSGEKHKLNSKSRYQIIELTDDRSSDANNTFKTDCNPNKSKMSYTKESKLKSCISKTKGNVKDIANCSKAEAIGKFCTSMSRNTTKSVHSNTEPKFKLSTSTDKTKNVYSKPKNKDHFERIRRASTSRAAKIISPIRFLKTSTGAISPVMFHDESNSTVGLRKLSPRKQRDRSDRSYISSPDSSRNVNSKGGMHRSYSLCHSSSSESNKAFSEGQRKITNLWSQNIEVGKSNIISVRQSVYKKLGQGTSYGNYDPQLFEHYDLSRGRNCVDYSDICTYEDKDNFNPVKLSSRSREFIIKDKKYK